MAMVKCEHCGYEQDPEVSRICDNCGRRLGRTRLDFGSPPEEEVVEEETVRCPICGVPTSKAICPSCGNLVRKREV